MTFYKVVMTRKHLTSSTYIVTNSMLKVFVNETLQIPGFDYKTIKSTIESDDIYYGNHAGKRFTITKAPDLKMSQYV